jgi:SAM-dependent methyltransferase
MGGDLASRTNEPLRPHGISEPGTVTGQNRSADFWHQRYSQQARWTASLRARAFELAGIAGAKRILEVGSGTGVIAGELQRGSAGRVYGVDVDRAVTRFAAAQTREVGYSIGDGTRLPFADQSLDVVATHFVLLWAREPVELLREAARVLRPGGWMLCLAEPDYGGRLDHPASLANLGRLQAYSLERQGADPRIGRRLRGLFQEAGIEEVTSGVLGAEWREPPEAGFLRSEWDTLAADLADLASAEELSHWKQADSDAWERGTRVLYVPTFYALGRRPS